MAGKYANYILFNRAWGNTISQLSMDQRGELLTALYEIADGREYHTENMILNMLIGVFGDEIKQNVSNYEEIREKNRQNRIGKTKEQKNEKTTVPKERKKEGMNEGRKERKKDGMNEGMNDRLLSFPSGKERVSDDTPPVGGGGRQTVVLSEPPPGWEPEPDFDDYPEE